MSQKKAMDIIAMESLWLSKPSSFNDPYDFRARFVLSSDPLLLRKHFQQLARRLVPSNRKGYVKKREASVGRAMSNALRNPQEIQAAADRSVDRHGVCCFTGNPRSILMWSHYSDSHRGICYQFRFTEDVETFHSCFRVNYQNKIATINFPIDKDRIIEDLVLRKSDVWAYEDEYRYVNPTGGDIPLTYNGRALSSIILGHRFPDSAKPALARILDERKRRGLPDVNVLRATCAKYRYQIRLSSHDI